MPFEAGDKLFQFHGRSMWPLFRDGDLVIVRPLPRQRLRVGDCVAFRTGREGLETVVVHRVCALAPGIRTRGDRRPEEDEDCVAPANLEGRVVGRIRFGVTTRIAGGWRGAITGRILQWLGRVDPARQARLGRMAREIRGLLAPLLERRLRNAIRGQFSRIDAGAKRQLILRGHPVATYDDQLGRWRVEWPDSLWIDPDRLPLPEQVGRLLSDIAESQG